MAINDGYKTVDNYIRTKFWYYLRGSELLDYRTKVTATTLITESCTWPREAFFSLTLDLIRDSGKYNLIILSNSML